AVATCFEVDEVWNVARRNGQAKLRPAQHVAIEELRAGPDRRHGGELVHRDRLGRSGPEHRDQRDGVVGALVPGGLRHAAARHQVRHLVRSAFELAGAYFQREGAVLAALSLSELRRLAVARRVEGYRRAGDGTAGALDLARDLAGGRYVARLRARRRLVSV